MKRRRTFGRTKRIEQENKVGLAYRNIARKKLERLYPEMPSHEIEDILIRGNLEEIEALADVRHGIVVVAEKLRELLVKDKVILPHDFTDVVTFSEDPEFDLEEIVIGIKLLGWNETKKAAITVRLLKEIHDEWVREHSDEFAEVLTKGDTDAQVNFMPFCLIGFHAAMTGYDYLEDILNVLTIATEHDTIKKFYERWKNRVLDEAEVVTENDVRYFIYINSPKDITEALCNDKEGFEKLIQEVIERM